MSDTPRTDVEFNTWTNYWKLREFCRQLERELAASKLDAERYRWLRDVGAQSSPDPWSLFRPGMTYNLDTDSWDAAVDAARAAAPEKSK